MARYSRIFGPTASFTIPTTFTTIPGFSETRQYDHGELLILYSLSITNSNATIQLVQARPTIDGAPVGITGRTFTLAAAEQGIFSFHHLVPTVEGIHTIELQILANIATLVTIPSRASEFTIIQLPLWDDIARLINL